MNGSDQEERVNEHPLIPAVRETDIVGQGGDMAAVQAGELSPFDADLLVEQVVIPSPARAVWEQIL